MSLKYNYTEFQKEIDNRNIDHLIHFTPTRNLYSILENRELMSRAKLENLDIEQFDISEIDLMKGPEKILDNLQLLFLFENLNIKMERKHLIVYLSSKQLDRQYLLELNKELEMICNILVNKLQVDILHLFQMCTQFYIQHNVFGH